MKNKNIAVIGLKGLPAFGGAATVGENIINQLKDKFKFTVYAITSHTDNKTSYCNGYNQIIFKKNKNNSINTFIYYLKSLFHVLFINKYDLIFLHHSESGFITPLLRLKYKVILTIHGVYFNNTDPKFNKIINIFFKWSEKLNMKYANTIISVSQQNAISCKEKYKREILYIPNGVNIPNLISCKSNEEYWVFAASRIYDIKGLHILLKAMRDINVTIRLKVIGDLGQRSSYQRKILSLSDGLNIEFIDIIKDKGTLFQLLKSAKLFVFPSTTEAMSMMLIEAAALSVPIIASDISANTSIFNNKEMLFFKSGDSNSLAKSLFFAEKNKRLMTQNAKNAFHRVRTEYKWDIISKKYNKIFNQLVI